MMFRFSQLFWIAVIALAIGISYLGAYECYKDAEKARALLCPKCVAAVSASPDSILNAPDPGDSLKKLVLLAIAAVLGIIFITWLRSVLGRCAPVEGRVAACRHNCDSLADFGLCLLAQYRGTMVEHTGRRPRDLRGLWSTHGARASTTLAGKRNGTANGRRLTTCES